jgi:CDP-diacylglycerol--glycerol-3-phosphate 3-phosphatidyltransferase/cardiolipin synthase
LTFATKITVFRILLIPVFITLANYYGESIKSGSPAEAWRWAAIGTFIVASFSDALDGFIARRFNQQSRLGTILDPIADKGLLLAAVITLTLSQWPVRFPIWFPALVISKEGVTVGGAFIVNHLVGDVRIHPHWTGKACTFFQMLAVCWVMLAAPFAIYPIALAGIFTVIAGAVYVMDGAHQLSRTNHAEP